MTPDKIRALVYNLSTQELEELIKIATGRKNEAMATARASFLDEVKAKAASLGMSLADLVGLGGGKTAQDAGPTGVKYRNPKTGETWSGRGRPARWITESRRRGRKGKIARFRPWHTDALLRYRVPWHRWALRTAQPQADPIESLITASRTGHIDQRRCSTRGFCTA